MDDLFHFRADVYVRLKTDKSNFEAGFFNA